VLYAGVLLCVNWTNSITLRMCGRHLPRRENALLTCYTTLVNFFGPLQSGPAMRAAYLKQKFRLSLRAYTFGSLIYYAFYAVISALFLLAGSGPHWPLVLGVTGLVIAGCAGILWLAHRRFAGHIQGFRVTPRLLAEMGVATLCQLLIVTAIYYIELRAVHTGASLLQAVTYGGAANFALFVSITPGAIGFREAFLAFSRQLHHISAGGILAASVIDRSVYVVFLGVVFLFTLSMHAGARFKRAAEAAE
jgi:uncharacterized membrane protein YbhN (UPF0104 family)